MTLPEALVAKAQAVKWLVLDVDGVMTDGSLTFTSAGEELKTFNILDGLAIKLLRRAGIHSAIITGRVSPMVKARADALGITELAQGREDKATALQELVERLSISLSEVAYMGDDLPDVGAIRLAGLGLTVANAHAWVKQHADFCTHTPGGQGAVREVCDMLLHARGEFERIYESYL